MTEYARALLDDLMGPDRDLVVKIEKNFYDENVCKHFLVDFCPNDLFINTKSDLGPCGKIHDEKLKNDFQQLPEREKQEHDYEAKFFWRVRGLIRDLDWKMRDAKRRLEQKGDEATERQNQILREEREEKMVLIEVKIKELQAELERCGEEGLVDEATEINDQIEGLNVQLEALKNEEMRENRMEACPVCGSLLIVNDSPDRVQAHLTGKQHTGFQKLRETYELLKDKHEANMVKKEDKKQSYQSNDGYNRGGRREGGGGGGYGDRDRSDRGGGYGDRDRRPPGGSGYGDRDRGGYQRRDSGSRYHDDRSSRDGDYRRGSGDNDRYSRDGRDRDRDRRDRDRGDRDYHRRPPPRRSSRSPPRYY